MKKKLEKAIETAVQNMGEFFTSHNIIDFILARKLYSRAYEDQLVSIKAQPDRNHAEWHLNIMIGKFLRSNSVRLEIELVGAIAKPLLNIHLSKTTGIGYYRRLDWSAKFITEADEEQIDTGIEGISSWLFE